MLLALFFINISTILAYNISNEELEQKFRFLFFNSSYDASMPPFYNTDEPLIVNIQLFISSIDSISASSNDFSMSFFLRQRWKDPRLRYEPVPGMKAFQLNHKSMNSVWVPDVFIVNEKEASVHTVIVPNKLMHIESDGSILYSVRISGKFTCDVDLTKYPLDQQVCPLIMESYGYTTDNLRLIWHDKPVGKRKMILSEFEYDSEYTFTCDNQYFGLNFSCVQMNLKLSRRYGYHLIQTYIPSCLVVILSWVNFWISIDATPARISLGLLTVLTMTTQGTNLPNLYYFKALDVWMVACLCFVFFALIEFAYVNVVSRVHERRRASSLTDAIGQVTHTSTSTIQTKQKRALANWSKVNSFIQSMANREKARNVDRVSRVLFPVAFIIFNVIYWTVYIFVKTCTVHKAAYDDCQ